MSIITRLSKNIFSIGVAALVSVLFIGHLVKVESVASAPKNAGSGTSIAVSDWQAIRQQYDPTYMARIQARDVSAASVLAVVTDWQAVREQYYPAYMAELNKKVIKKTSSGCGGRDH